MLWGGRFKEMLNTDALRFSSSLSFDKMLLQEDIEASIAHAEMLASSGLISEDECRVIIQGLSKVEAEYFAGNWIPDEKLYEDIHSAVEARLFQVAGPAAGKLHTGRSRNDQIATDTKLWVKKAALLVKSNLLNLQKVLLTIAEKHTETVIPGYTHMQRAQPVSFAFHLLAYMEMLQRDIERFSFVFKETDQCPLGAGALAGSTLPIDREYTSSKLGFEKPTGNALDTVADRDYLLDFLNGCSIGMMHLSRLSEEIVLWSSSEWKFVRLSDSFTTGSSLMPQKKNPDMAELIRGKVGRVYGNYIALSTTMKGLPLSYNRDMQEDKEPVLDSFNTYTDCLEIMRLMLQTMEVNKERFVKELKEDYTLATDLADWLVLKGVPFRESHKIVGGVVKYSEDNKLPFCSLTAEDLRSIHPVFDESALECLNMDTAIKRKKTCGSPNPELVANQIVCWKSKMKI